MKQFAPDGVFTNRDEHKLVPEGKNHVEVMNLIP